MKLARKLVLVALVVAIGALLAWAWRPEPAA